MTFKVKPTSAQRQVLLKLGEGYELMTVNHCDHQLSSSAFLSKPPEKTISVRYDYVQKFMDWGWVKVVSDPAWAWRSATYKITETGREALTLGVRK